MSESIDWECVDCGCVYVADETTGSELDHDEGVYTGWGVDGLPSNCPECGDHGGWRKRGDIE